MCSSPFVRSSTRWSTPWQRSFVDSNCLALPAPFTFMKFRGVRRRRALPRRRRAHRVDPYFSSRGFYTMHSPPASVNLPMHSPRDSFNNLPSRYTNAPPPRWLKCTPLPLHQCTPPALVKMHSPLVFVGTPPDSLTTLTSISLKALSAP